MCVEQLEPIAMLRYESRVVERKWHGMAECWALQSYELNVVHRSIVRYRIVIQQYLQWRARSVDPIYVYI